MFLVGLQNCDNTFNAAKDFMCSALIAIPNFSQPFKLEVDVRGQGAGGALLQEVDSGIEHPCAIFPKCFLRLNKIILQLRRKL